MSMSKKELNVIMMVIASFVLGEIRLEAVEVVNSGFETPVVANYDKIAVDYDPPTDGLNGGWTFLGAAGVARNGSPWVNTAPEGEQVLYLQNNSDVTQSITLDNGGYYQISFKAANRPNYSSINLRVLFDDRELAFWNAAQIDNDAVFQSFSADIGFQHAGTYTLMFDGVPHIGDCALAIDDVQISLVGSAVARYWNPSPLSSNWNATVWADISVGTPAFNWSSGSCAVFDQSQSYAVTLDDQESAKTIEVEEGTVTLNGAGAVTTDNITIESGATLSGAGERYLKTGFTPVYVDGTLDLTAMSDTTRIAYLYGSGTVELSAGANLAVDGSSAFTGVISGSGDLTKVGSGTLTVDNSFSGPLSIQGGTLLLPNSISGAATVATDAGLGFVSSAHMVTAMSNPSASFAIGSMVGLANAVDLTDPNLGGVSFNDVLFLKAGAGILTINNAATLSGVSSGMVITDGKIILRYTGLIDDDMPITLKDNGWLHLTYQDTSTLNINNPIYLSGRYDEGSSDGALYIQKNNSTTHFNAPITLLSDSKIKAFAATETVNFNAPIVGNGNLVIGGGGAGDTHLKILNFNAACTFNGNVILQNENRSDAEFNWGVDNAMPTNAIIRVGGNTVENHTHLDLKGFTQKTAGIANAKLTAGDRAFVNSAATPATLEMNVAAGTQPGYNGALRNHINLIKRGGGTQYLAGAGAEHSGDVLVAEGTLLINGGALPNADVTVADGGRIEANQINTTVAHTTISGNGGVTDRYGAIYFYHGDDNWNGDITIDGDAYIGSYGGDVKTKTINGTIDGSGTLRFWAQGGADLHESVFVLTEPCTFEGPLQLDAARADSNTLKLSGGDNLLPADVPLRFNLDWRNHQIFCRLDLAGTTAQQVGELSSMGISTNQCRAVVNSVAGTTTTLTLNTHAGATFEGLIGASGACVSPGAINLVKEGGGAQIFVKGNEFKWNDDSPGTNAVHANVTVNNGAIGFSGTDMLSDSHSVTINAAGALIAPDTGTLNALRADSRITLDPASPIGLYGTWDISAVDPARMFYFYGDNSNTRLTEDYSNVLTNGLILADVNLLVERDGTAGDSVFGPTSAPLIINGASIKNFNNAPVLSADRVITVNQGGAGFTAGWNLGLQVLSQLTGNGSVNINCDNGAVVLGNSANDYSGDTIIATKWSGASGSTATLKLGASEVIPHGAGKGSFVLNSGATLDLNGFNETVNALSAADADALITNSVAMLATLTVGADDTDGSYNGVIGGLVQVVKSGSGRQSLAGACASMADTIVENGTLALTESCTVASKDVKVKRDATLELVSTDVFGGTATCTRLYAGIDKSTQGDQAKIDIQAGVDVTVLHFAIDGVFKTAGTWGATGSGADNIDDTVFSGGGLLTVLETGPASGTMITVR